MLYFSANYNFGNVDEGKAVTLYTLGRIFEQSITELEALEAEADNRPSLTKITKRKRDGVYYTPEKIVEKIVEETVGARLADLRREAGWLESLDFDSAAIEKLAKPMQDQIKAIDAYRGALEAVTVVDPACGSGAFLIHALEYLLRERRRVGLERERLTGNPLLFDQEEQIRTILSRNLYGVDINPASVEIARLALWLHTARADRPLCDLDRNVVTGNSLISPDDFARWNSQMPLLPDEEKERINTFSWATAFPSVFEEGGFDCVIGNPPYVKLQNLRKVQSNVAGFLKEARTSHGQPLYRSAQAGNFDLFLPFIEKGIGLLNPRGRMGFIAPSLWRLNEYGAPLRRFLLEGRHLDRWLDFKDHQVFEEAVTYTALQFFTRSTNDQVRFTNAPDGGLATTWDDPACSITYSEAELSPLGDTWVFLPERERRFIQRLVTSCKRLDETGDIVVGIQTSADHIYHLRRIRPGVYESRANKAKAVEVQLEDALMHPLVSGPEVDRYGDLATETYLLFPYSVNNRGAFLLSAEQLLKDYPNCWRYLRMHEPTLRARESQSFDDPQWYRLGRNQNLDKNHLPKLVVAGTVKELEVALDAQGKSYLNNVRVNGILSSKRHDLAFLLGILNAPLANWVFQRIAKPKDGNFLEANRQFTAPLPIPYATDEGKRHIAAYALNLTRWYGRLRRLEHEIDRRLAACVLRVRDEEWLLPKVGSLATWKERIPVSLRGQLRTQWAKQQRALALTEQLNLVQAQLKRQEPFESRFQNGELLLTQGGRMVLAGIFVSNDEGPFLKAQWQTTLRRIGKRVLTAPRLLDMLRNVRTTANAALIDQVIDLSAQAQQLRAKIDAKESELNEIIFTLYDLSAEERAMVLAG